MAQDSSSSDQKMSHQTSSDPLIAFVGGGAMASALAAGFLKSQSISSPSRLVFGEPFDKQRDRLKTQFGEEVNVVASNVEAIEGADVIWIAVKPQVVDQALKSIQHFVKPNQLVISIAAGVPLSKLEFFLPKSPVIRVMPNTPALVAEMAAGFTLGALATGAHRTLVVQLLESLGIAVEVKEFLLHAVTGLSGSGPAYVFLMIEAMADGGVRSGLPRNVALKLAAQTVLGAAKMVKDLNIHPGELKDMVTSPAGTTISGVHALERSGFRAGVIDAVYAASQRSVQLEKGSKM